MSYEEDMMCVKCKRSSSCQYPCEQYRDYTMNKSLMNVNKIDAVEDKEGIEYMDTTNTYDYNNIDDIIVYDVSDPSYLQIVNGLRMPSDGINFRLLLDYMNDKNKDYAEENNLCPICHSELEDYDDNSEHFGTPVNERVRYCPHGC